MNVEVASMRGEEGNSLKVPARLFGAGTALERTAIAVRGPSDPMSRMKIPSTTLPLPLSGAVAAASVSLHLRLLRPSERARERERPRSRRS